MKRLILSVLTIGIVSIAAVGATRAYFSDQATVQGAQITTGTLNISLKGPGNIYGGFYFPVNLMPGESTNFTDPHGLTHEQRIGINIEEGSVTPDHFELQVKASNFVDGNVESGVVSGMNTYLKSIEVTSLYNHTDNWQWHQLINQIDDSQDGKAGFRSLYDLIHTPVIRNIAAGSQLNSIGFTFAMPTTVGNELQGDSLQLEFIVAAAQASGQKVL